MCVIVNKNEKFKHRDRLAQRKDDLKRQREKEEKVDQTGAAAPLARQQPGQQNLEGGGKSYSSGVSEGTWPCWPVGVGHLIPRTRRQQLFSS